jgi:primary-amine oxidase
VPPAPPHPLDPLSADEIRAAVALVRAAEGVPADLRFADVELVEPPKDAVLAWGPDRGIERQVHLRLVAGPELSAIEAVVSLDRNQVVSLIEVDGVSPTLLIEEGMYAAEAVRAHPEWQAAMRRRGLTDFSVIEVDPWAAGRFGFPEEEGRRLARAISYLRERPEDNGYARPIEGVIAVVDLGTAEVLSVEDHGMVPVPTARGRYKVGETGPSRTGLRPIEIIQPEGPSFTLDGHMLRWQRWSMHVSLDPHEGIVLHTVGYEDGGRIRPILYRASVTEMVVPYGDPGPMHGWKNAFDAAEWGLGKMANSLELGCDCLGEIRYLDATMTNERGTPYLVRNAICIHEEDHGIGWKHVDLLTGSNEVRRSRRLVVSSIVTAGNYDYGFYWYFYQDGTLEYQVKMTGVISNGATLPGERPKWGVLVAPQVYGPIHQHFFNVRLDMMIDGPNNSVFEINTVKDPQGPENPHDNAFHTEATLLATESQAQRVIDPLSARFWTIANPGSANRLGDPVAYKLVPGENVLPFAGPGSSVLKRAAFATKHLWVTRYHPLERYAAGDYPNQHPGGAGLPAYTQDDEPVDNTDVVVWYTFGAHHIVRPEDWPVMPVSYIGFSLKPLGFFDRNPALDVAPPMLHGGEVFRSC